MLIKSDHCTYFVFCDQSTSHLCTCLPRPVRQVESRNKTSDIHRPFCPFLRSSSPWIKYKEVHRSFQKFRFAKEVLFPFPIHTMEGKILITHLTICISIFPSGNSIGKAFHFTRFTKNNFYLLCTIKKHGRLVFP